MAIPPDTTTPSLTFLCSRFRPERYGGVEERLWHITQALSNDDVPVEVITENRGGFPETEQFGPLLSVRRIRPLDEGRLWRIYYAVKAYQWRAAAARLVSGSVIWATEPSMAVGALTVVPRRPVVFNPAACAAGMRSIWRLRPEVDSMNVPRHLIMLDRLAYRFSDAVVVSSVNVQAQFERAYGARTGAVQVVPHAVESPAEVPARASVRSRFGMASDTFCVGFVGRLDPCKDVPFLIEAVARMADRRNVRLLFVGVGPDEARIRRKAQESGLQDHVIWTGQLSELAEAYAAMDVLVLPSVYEAFGLVLLEAMVMGVPAIARASNATSVLTASSEIIPPSAGIVVPADGLAELTNALEMLQRDPATRVSMGQEARRVALQWNWRDVAREYARITHVLA
jgi:glycosyltransferase involved in cell wall biosynthesis